MNSAEMRAYKIESKWRFAELYAYTLQYWDWKNELENYPYLSAQDIDGMPKGSSIGDPAGEMAIRIAALATKVSNIENSARLCSPDKHIQEAVLKGVTTAESSYEWLQAQGKIYCGRRQYYEARRRFYWHLNNFV